MICINCGSKVQAGFTTEVRDLGNCLVIIRNVPCFKCSECTEITFTADVIEKLDLIVEKAKTLLQEISIIDYEKLAA